MKILICAPVIPYPTADGLRLRIFNLCRELAQRHEVHLFCLSRMAPSLEQESALAEAGLGLTVALKPFLSPEDKITAYLKRLAQGVPPELILSWENTIYKSLKDLQHEQRFDVALGEHLFMGRFLLAADCPKILVEHNIEGDLTKALVRHERIPRRWFKMIGAVWIAHYEKKVLRRVQGATAVTVNDAARLKALAPKLPVSVVENGVDCDEYAEMSAAPKGPGDSLLFVGLMSYPANIDAVRWFADEIFPLVSDRHPGTVFSVVGKDPTPEILSLDNGTTVRVLGYVDDIHPWHRANSIMVAPLRSGGGSRLKILEAFAAGTPVISTSKGAEGLEVEDGRHLLIADSPQDFAWAVTRLSEDDELYQKLRVSARALVEEKYDWPVLAAKLEAAITEVAGAGIGAGTDGIKTG